MYFERKDPRRRKMLSTRDPIRNENGSYDDRFNNLTFTQDNRAKS